MNMDDEIDFNWNLAPALIPAWILCDNVYGNSYEVPVYVFGIGAFRRMQIGVRTADRVTAERILMDRNEFSRMPNDLFAKVVGEAYEFLGHAMLAPRPHAT